MNSWAAESTFTKWSLSGDSVPSEDGDDAVESAEITTSGRIRHCLIVELSAVSVAGNT